MNQKWALARLVGLKPDLQMVQLLLLGFSKESMGWLDFHVMH
jgi:hypothetical protein